MGDRPIDAPSPSILEVHRELQERGAFASLAGRREGCGALEMKVAEACQHCLKERRGAVSVRQEMRALWELAAANRATARHVRRDHPRVAARLEQFAAMAEGATTRAGRRTSPGSGGSDRIDHLVATLFVIAWHTTDLARVRILADVVPPILQAMSEAYPDDFQDGSRVDPEARFRRYVARTLRWINACLRKRPAPYASRELISHWRHLAFTDDDRFPAGLSELRDRRPRSRGKRRLRGGAAGRN